MQASMIGMAPTPGVHAGIHTQGDYFQQTNSQQQLQSGQQQERPLYLCQPFVKAALVKGSFKTIVAPPKYVDVNEWVAINIFDFYNNLNHFYGAISEFCGPHQCHTMSAASGLDFTWPDQNKRQVSLPASTYIDYVMSWVQRLLEDESVFPTKSGRDFQPSFPSTAKHIYKQLFRIFAHIYHAHFSEILHLSLEAHFNSLFAHYIAFGREYDLLDAQDTRELRTRGGGVMWLTDKWAEMGILEGSDK
ncbi:hypothetical protein QFC24_005057 [Naganishia onofrii]|uniref:Uncharacterized protein n=1 Tax=Naganishia onofrii TaxID=1851511 RepID=A0ACC2XDC5_9TREE|nr:hypothetical protein QFC24_005057 [Naganishia onofrii]